MACSNWDELSNPTFSFNSHQNWFRRPRSLFPHRHSTSRCHWHHSHLDLQISRPGRNMSGAVILCDWFTPKHWQNWSLWSTQWILDYVNHFKTYMTPWDSTFFNCYNDFVGWNISFNVQSVLIEICDSLDVYVRCWGTILKNIQLLLQACGREDGDEVQHGSRCLAITNDADVNWLNHKRCGRCSQYQLGKSARFHLHLQDPHPKNTENHMWSAQNKESLKVAWHPNSRNPLLPAPGCRSVDLNKTWYGKLSFIFQHLKYSWKSRSQALAQHCFCFKNSPTTNLKENHIQDWFPWWTFTYIWKSKPTRIPKPMEKMG